MTHEDVVDMLTRMETRLVRGFTKLGVDPCTRGDAVLYRVDRADKVAYVTRRDVTLAQVYKQLLREGVHDSHEYAIKHTGDDYVRD